MPTSVLAALAKDLTVQELINLLPPALVNGGLPVTQGADVTQGPTALTAGQAITISPVPQGHRSVTIVVTSTDASGVAFEWQDANGSWRAMPIIRMDNTATLGMQTATFTNGAWYSGDIPSGALGVRVRSNGNSTSILSTSSQPRSSVFALLGTLGALGSGGNRIGRIAADASWFDETVTPLGISGTFTGSAHDVVGTSTGGQITGTQGPQGTAEFRAQAISDQPGVLCLEVSRDNATWRRVRSVPTGNVGTDATGVGTNYVAEISCKPSCRYLRWVFVNGNTAQTFFQLETLGLSA